MPGPSDPDRRRALVALGVSTTVLPLAAAAATPTGPTTTAPGAPTALDIDYVAGPDDQGRFDYEASWAEPSDDGGAPVDLYEHGLWNGADQNVVSGTQLSTSTTYLEHPDNAVTFKVRARNSVGWGPYAETSVPTPP